MNDCENCKYGRNESNEPPCVNCALPGLCFPLFEQKEEAVDHPEHYQGKHECIDEMVAMFGIQAVIDFCKCNVYKYRFRADKKNGAEDLQKAEWYMDKLIELNEELEVPVQFQKI